MLSMVCGCFVIVHCLAMDGAQLTLFCSSLEYLTLNIKRPELCPYPFKLYSATDMPGVEDDELHDGFVLAMRAEYQDMVGGTHFVKAKTGTLTAKTVKQFKFKAWVAGDKEIRVAVPLLGWSDRGNDDVYIKDQYKDEHDVIMAAFDVGRNGYIKRVGVDSYENKEKIYVLRLQETDDTNIKLSGSVLSCNKKMKKVQLQEPGLLAPLALNLTMDLSSLEDDLEELSIEERKVCIWKVAQVPRLVWQVANVAKQPRRHGVMKEDVEASDDDDDIVAQMSKKVHGMSIGKPE